MKKTILIISIILLSAMTAWADVVINENNFPDEVFRNYVRGQSYGMDGVLTDAEIAGVISLNVSNWNIKSLKGIEYFRELRNLFCYTNQLTSLDVSKNTVLEDLRCDRNQLTSLDVSKNTALTYLACYNNQLTSLDVSKNTALTGLRCDGNQLTSLDVSKNTALTSLNCGHNQLTSLDVLKHTALTSLYCGFNELTSLNVSKNTALTRLDCQSNQLTSLDVSKNTALTVLSCFENKLTSLDLSKNTALKAIDCSENQIKDAGMDALVESLPTVDEGKMYAIYSCNEGNVMTTVQVEAAKAKGWTVYQCIGFADWQIYAGSEEDPDGIGNVNNNNNVNDVYDLSGRKINSQSATFNAHHSMFNGLRKGIYIVDGKKVWVK